MMIVCSGGGGGGRRRRETALPSASPSGASPTKSSLSSRCTAPGCLPSAAACPQPSIAPACFELNARWRHACGRWPGSTWVRGGTRGARSCTARIMRSVASWLLLYLAPRLVLPPRSAALRLVLVSIAPNQLCKPSQADCAHGARPAHVTCPAVLPDSLRPVSARPACRRACVLVAGPACAAPRLSPPAFGASNPASLLLHVSPRRACALANPTVRPAR
jgi:hypothetical protein